jgi:hypothetical protein
MDLPSLTTIFTSLSFARDAITTALGMKTFNDASARITEAREQLLKAQDGLFVYAAKVAELQDKLRVTDGELRELKHMKLERSHYALVEISKDAWAYRSKPVLDAGEHGLDAHQPSHYVCQGCFDDGRKFVLQRYGVDLICPSCKTIVATGERIRITRTRDFGDD